MTRKSVDHLIGLIGLLAIVAVGGTLVSLWLQDWLGTSFWTLLSGPLLCVAGALLVARWHRGQNERSGNRD